MCVVAAVSAAALLGGCVQRTISITSDPPGALVELNDEEVGRTPVTVPFTFYGTYDVYLEADGYTSLRTERVAEAPWWEAPGPDLVAEALPGVNSVDLKWHFAMEPTRDVDPQLLLDHGRQMRALLERGTEARSGAE